YSENLEHRANEVWVSWRLPGRGPRADAERIAESPAFGNGLSKAAHFPAEREIVVGGPKAVGVKKANGRDLQNEGKDYGAPDRARPAHPTTAHLHRGDQTSIVTITPGSTPMRVLKSACTRGRLKTAPSLLLWNVYVQSAEPRFFCCLDRASAAPLFSRWAASGCKSFECSCAVEGRRKRLASASRLHSRPRIQ